MRHRLPSLSALRAFEAAARHESITLAGEELSVSPGAVSRHVGLLEAHFDCRLFHRRQHGVELTEKGRHFYGELAPAFDRIDKVCDELMGAADTNALRVSIYTTFASDWLLPRLATFRKRFPSIDLSLVASLRTVNFEADEIDVAVTTEKLKRKSISQDRLFSPLYFPVCSPDLLRDEPPLRAPEDLKRHNLLHSASQIPNWRAWLEAAGVPDVTLERGLAFENSSLAFKAAREGAGVALGQQLFLTQDLVAGRLVAPFDLSLRSAKSYFLVCPRRRLKEPPIQAFREWFLSEVSAALEQSEAQLPELREKIVDAAGG